ncbi:MAG: Bax inhibitor-1/YccA family protein [Synergistaceae bacterium]|nr:Bax inhibitor-1/YccA family protein [Synergistaceae bacterium]
MSQFENYTMPYSFGSDNVEAVNAVFKKVYQYMALGLILTALTAWFTASSPAMIKMLFSSQVPLIVLAVAEIGLVIYLGASINKLAASTAFMLFAVYSVLNGLTCSVVLLVYTGESVYKAFLSTAGMFGAMSIYGIYTKRDLISFGSFLRMGLFGIIIAMVINLFVRSSMMEFYISIIGLIIFLGLTIYDTSRIKLMANEFGDSDSETVGRIAVIGALELYLDFINIFLYMLRFFGKQRD